jgi:hypothetical protein
MPALMLVAIQPKPFTPELIPHGTEPPPEFGSEILLVDAAANAARCDGLAHKNLLVRYPFCLDDLSAHALYYLSSALMQEEERRREIEAAIACNDWTAAEKAALWDIMSDLREYDVLWCPETNRSAICCFEFPFSMDADPRLLRCTSIDDSSAQALMNHVRARPPMIFD